MDRDYPILAGRLEDQTPCGTIKNREQPELPGRMARKSVGRGSSPARPTSDNKGSRGSLSDREVASSVPLDASRGISAPTRKRVSKGNICGRDSADCSPYSRRQRAQ